MDVEALLLLAAEEDDPEAVDLAAWMRCRMVLACRMVADEMDCMAATDLCFDWASVSSCFSSVTKRHDDDGVLLILVRLVLLFPVVLLLLELVSFEFAPADCDSSCFDNLLFLPLLFYWIL